MRELNGSRRHDEQPDAEAETDDMSREGDAVCKCLDLRAGGCVSSETVREGAVLKSNELLLVLFEGVGFEWPTK